MGIFVGVDVGGTFTDFCVNIPEERRWFIHKVRSTPAQPELAIADGLRELFSVYGLDPANVVRLAHGTTVGTNALIERRCGKVAVLTTEGFRDLLEIGRQVRPRVYDVHLDQPVPLVPRNLRFEVQERRLSSGAVLRPLDEAQVESLCVELEKEQVDAVAVCFLHSYAYPEHEERAAAIVRRTLRRPAHVVTSSSVYPEFREYERFSTTVLNAALLTVMEGYLERLCDVAKPFLAHGLPLVSQSAGGLMSLDAAKVTPIRAALSGPAAGVLGAVQRAKQAGYSDVITFDVGGTSTDVSLLTNGEPQVVHSRALGGFPLRLPAIDVQAVGAGGGSIAWIDRDGLLKVGPHSAGADPGPACYDRGGRSATVTDANLLLGRLSADGLLGGRMRIDCGLAEEAITEVARTLRLDVTETALGIVRVATAAMVRAIRTISVDRGHDPASYSLVAYGGAGPLHATEVARELGMRRVIVPPNPGILCAEGLLSSDLTRDFVRSVVVRLEDDSWRDAEAARRALFAEAESWFKQEEIPCNRRATTCIAEMRYVGQNFELPIPVQHVGLSDASCRELLARFHEAHDRAYGHSNESEAVELVNLRVQARGVLQKTEFPTLCERSVGDPVTYRSAVFDTPEASTPVFRRTDLSAGQVVKGPAIIEQLDTTVLVFPSDICQVDSFANLIISLG